MKKKLRIAQIAPLWFPVPPIGYGGTELVVSNLTEELIRRGHKVTLFASGDSRTKAKLISVVERNLRSLNIPWLHDSYNIVNLVTAFSKKKEFDLIHTHIDVHDPLARGYNSDVPSVATLHNPFWPEPNEPKKNKHWFAYQGRVDLYNKFPKLPYISISDSYKRQCPAEINFLKTIHHGIRLDSLKFNFRGGSRFVWIGRICRAKGTHIAVRIAKKLGICLDIAGAVVNEEAGDFFKSEVKPFLNKNINYVGEIKSEKDKSDFLGNAKGFLYPLQWEEPFGLTMIEAQACGTPVIAFRKGSVPEIVKDGETGYVVGDRMQFEGAIKKIDHLDRLNCRKNVENNFTVEKMADKHEELYYRLIKDWDRVIGKKI